MPTGPLRFLSTASVLVAAFVGSAGARPPEPASVGRDRPLTSSWLCENERSVLINAHPRRRAEEAWLTYAGTRVAVRRVPADSGVAFKSKDGKVKWHESGDEARLQFDGLLAEPVTCRRVDRPRR